MKYTKEQLDIMAQAEFDDEGKPVNMQMRLKQNDSWSDFTNRVAWQWEIADYRIKPTNQYVPYDFTKNLAGRKIKSKVRDIKYSIVTQTNDGVYVYTSVWHKMILINYQELLDQYLSIQDNKPLGKLITQ